MSNTDVNVVKYTTQEVVGDYIVTDAPATFNQDGTLATPVKYSRRQWPQSNLKLQSYVETRSGNSTPGFNGPNRPRFPAPLSFYYSKVQQLNSFRETRTQRAGSGTVAPIDSYYRESPTTAIDQGGGFITQADVDSLDARAVTDLRNKIKGMSINAAQAVAERNKTAKTVTDAAVSIAQAIRAVRKGDMASAAKALGVSKPRGRKQGVVSDVADVATRRWLELQYGWKPLLNDVYGAAEQMAKAHNNVQFRTVKVAKTLYREKTTSQDIVAGQASDAKGYYIKRNQSGQRFDIKYGVTFSQTASTPTTLKQLGITNPALIAWELVPFSFVADWFLPVGNYLESLDATLGLTFVSGYKTTFSKTNWHNVIDANYTTGGGSTREYVFGMEDGERIVVNRYPLSGFPSAMTPSFKNPVSVTHAASALSLLYQLFKR